MPWSWYIAWGIVCLAVFLIGLTKSGFGAGVGLMIVPMAAIAMDYIPGRRAQAALGLLLPLLIVGDFVALWQYRRYFTWRKAPAPALAGVVNGPVPTLPIDVPTADPAPTPPSALLYVRRLLPGTALGVVLGGLLLWWFHQQPPRLLIALIKIEIGCESILLVGLYWWRQYRGRQRHLVAEPWRSHVTGSFSAVSSTLAHAAGPIVAMYLLPLNLSRQLFVGTCAIYFFILNTAKLPAYYEAGMFQRASVGFALRFVPIVLAGAVFGFWVNRKLSDRLFSRVVYLITFLLGWYMIYDGLVPLLR